jgi:hypothetical protein
MANVVELTIGNIADKDDARGWSCRHIEVSVMRAYLEEERELQESKNQTILVKVNFHVSQSEDKKRRPKM